MNRCPPVSPAKPSCRAAPCIGCAAPCIGCAAPCAGCAAPCAVCAQDSFEQAALLEKVVNSLLASNLQDYEKHCNLRPNSLVVKYTSIIYLFQTNKYS